MFFFSESVLLRPCIPWTLCILKDFWTGLVRVSEWENQLNAARFVQSAFFCFFVFSWGMFPISNRWTQLVVYICFPLFRDLDGTNYNDQTADLIFFLWFSKRKLPKKWIRVDWWIILSFTQINDMDLHQSSGRLLKFCRFLGDQEEHLDQRGLLRCLWGGDDFWWSTSGLFSIDITLFGWVFWVVFPKKTCEHVHV